MTHYQYVPAKTSHILHLVLTMITFGFWSPVWFAMWLYNHNRTVLRLVPSAYPAQYVQGQSAGHQMPVQPSAQLQAAPVWADHVWHAAIDYGYAGTDVWCSTHQTWSCAKSVLPAPASQVA